MSNAPFVSYAQNFEDVVLFRTLQSVKVGFYIDVGAWEPVTDSVTKAFYDRGWCGVNIEPVSKYYTALKIARERDVNLQLAVTDKPGIVTLYEYDETGLSTIEKGVVSEHQRSGLPAPRETDVPAVTLTQVCERYAPEQVHFLKIDVEGGELDVLRGTDLRRFRPWIIVVEATKPNTPVLVFQEWESLILSEAYHFAYFDGLNRFYVADEHRELIELLSVPPNVFDRFIIAETVSLKERLVNSFETGRCMSARISEIEQRSGELEERLARSEDERLEFERRLRSSQASLQALESSSQQLEEGLTAQLRQKALEMERERMKVSLLEERVIDLRSDLESANESVLRIGERFKHAVGDLERTNDHARGLSDRALGLQTELALVYSSKSWKLSAPLRSGLNILHAIGGAGRRWLRLLRQPNQNGQPLQQGLTRRLLSMSPVQRLARRLYGIAPIRQAFSRVLKPFPRLERAAVSTVMMETAWQNDVEVAPQGSDSRLPESIGAIVRQIQRTSDVLEVKRSTETL